MFNNKDESMRKAAALLVFGMTCTGSAVADESNQIWHQMASGERGSEAFSYSAKKGSFKHEGKSSVIIAQEKITNTALNNNSINFYKVVVADQACNNGYGKVKYLSLDGKPVFDAEFMKDGESIASSVGSFICMVRDELIKRGEIK